MTKIWEDLEMTQEDWWLLARAFYCLAHNDFKKFNALPDKLKKHPAGKLCSRYMKTRDHDLVEQAGKILTHSHHWYVYLGRIM